MSSIAAIIITKNEERNIAACIETVLWVDEIIVLDCGSDDKTTQISQAYASKVRLYMTNWLGFGKQKNRALALTTATWVLSLDADERITPELKDEILRKLNSNYAAYQIPRLSYFLNKPIKHCYGKKSDAPVRLFKNGCGKFTDDIVHEQIIVVGAVGKLQNQMLHFSFASMEQLINKINTYSTLSAAKLKRNQVRTTYFQVLVHASWAFLKVYFLRRGFLDGWVGFIIAFSNFAEVFYKYAKLLEKNVVME